MAKWIEVGDLTRTAADVAAEVLHARLAVVRERLPLAAHEFRDDSEHVHQLRVGCRRAGAALQAFRPLLRGKAKRLRKSLRQIRRAAGPARDTDVLLQRLAKESSIRPCHELIISRLHDRREQVQVRLIDAASMARLADLDSGLRRCRKAFKKCSRSAQADEFGNYASQALSVVSQQMLDAADLEQATLDELHQFRIAGKRMRYSIELFHDAMPDALREEVYPQVEEIQSRLGMLNDHATAQRLYQHWLAKMPADEQAAQLAQRIVQEHEAAVAVRGDFLNWWSTSRSTTFRSQITDLLST